MRLPADQIEYVGTSDLPDEFAWGAGLTKIDGEQIGCMATQHGALVTATIPETGGRAAFIGRFTMFNPVEVLDELKESMPSGEKVSSTRPFDCHWDSVTGKLWWTFGSGYVEAQHNLPFLGCSELDQSTDYEGLFGWGREWAGSMSANPLHSAKMYLSLSDIPDGIANQYFNGNRAGMGCGIFQGPRGGSQGPSMYTWDPNSNLADTEPTPLCWYKYVPNSYVEQWKFMDKLELRNGDKLSGNLGDETISVTLQSGGMIAVKKKDIASITFRRVWTKEKKGSTTGPSS